MKTILAPFSNTIEIFEFVEGGRWRSIMHGPERTDYPNESRFLEIVRERRVVVEHVSGHHVILALDLAAQGGHAHRWAADLRYSCAL